MKTLVRNSIRYLVVSGKSICIDLLQGIADRPPCSAGDNVTLLMTKSLDTKAFCLAGQPALLIVIQPEPSAAELFSKDPIFFAQIIDGILLLLIHPAGHGDEHKPEWVKGFRRSRVQSLLCICRSGRQRLVLSISSDFRTLRE